VRFGLDQIAARVDREAHGFVRARPALNAAHMSLQTSRGEAYGLPQWQMIAAAM
jgi:hypothetical protein